MIARTSSEFTKGATPFWQPNADVQVVVEAFPPDVQRTIRWAGYYIANGTLRLSNLYADAVRDRNRYRNVERYNLLDNGVEAVMSAHVWRCLESGIEAETVVTDMTRMQKALQNGRRIGEIAASFEGMHEGLTAYQKDLLEVARGITDVAVISGGDTHSLTEQAADDYTELVLAPLIQKGGLAPRR